MTKLRMWSRPLSTAEILSDMRGDPLITSGLVFNFEMALTPDKKVRC